MATVQRQCIVEVEYIGPELEFNDNVHGAMKRVWHDAADVFRSVTIDLGGGPIGIEGDWGPAFSEGGAKSFDLRLSAERLHPREALNTGEIYLSLVFLAMNLAVPGAANFPSVHIRTSEGTGARGRWSSAPFEGVWVFGDRWPWAQPSEVSLADTWNWLQHLQPMGSQVAQGAVQRALFSLLHSAQESDLSPTILIWLCSALEALYDVPAETIGRTLRNRIFLLLGRPASHTVAARQIAKLYDLRSKFAHGSFEVVHPLANDLLDCRVLRIHEAILPIFSLGYALVLSTLQHMIRNGWRALRFDETLLGERATSGSVDSAPNQGMELTR
jgi:Apea-like HEPN